MSERLTFLGIEEEESFVHSLGVVVRDCVGLVMPWKRFDNEDRKARDHPTKQKQRQKNAAHSPADDHAPEIYSLLLLRLAGSKQPALLRLLETPDGGSVHVRVARPAEVIVRDRPVQLRWRPSPLIIHLAEMAAPKCTSPAAAPHFTSRLPYVTEPNLTKVNKTLPFQHHRPQLPRHCSSSSLPLALRPPNAAAHKPLQAPRRRQLIGKSSGLQCISHSEPYSPPKHVEQLSLSFSLC